MSAGSFFAFGQHEAIGVVRRQNRIAANFQRHDGFDLLTGGKLRNLNGHDLGRPFAVFIADLHARRNVLLDDASPAARAIRWESAHSRAIFLHAPPVAVMMTPHLPFLHFGFAHLHAFRVGILELGEGRRSGRQKKIESKSEMPIKLTKSCSQFLKQQLALIFQLISLF